MAKSLVSCFFLTHGVVGICLACFIIAPAVFQSVSSQFRVGSFAAVQQLQLQVDGVADWLSCQAAEP